jgi:hypothetical protein
MARTITRQLITACKQYCLAAGATQGNIAYTQNVSNRKNAPKSNFGPRQVTENELKNVFKDRWQIQEILPAIFHNTASTKIPAILAIIKLNNK